MVLTPVGLAAFRPTGGPPQVMPALGPTGPVGLCDICGAIDPNPAAACRECGAIPPDFRIEQLSRPAGFRTSWSNTDREPYEGVSQKLSRASSPKLATAGVAWDQQHQSSRTGSLRRSHADLAGQRQRRKRVRARAVQSDRGWHARPRSRRARLDVGNADAPCARRDVHDRCAGRTAACRADRDASPICCTRSRAAARSCCPPPVAQPGRRWRSRSARGPRSPSTSNPASSKPASVSLPFPRQVCSPHSCSWLTRSRTAPGS